MILDRTTFIRQEEKKYHDFCYDHYKLFEAGSWLHKPVQTVMESLSSFQNQGEVNVLDLGCGVGRNSIPIAQAIQKRKGKVVCVDLLDSALTPLRSYSHEYGVDSIIRTEKADIGNYPIKPNEYDYIVAVSCLEHVRSETEFEQVIEEMVHGTKRNGVNCIITNSNAKETDLETGHKSDALIEVNLSTERMMKKLKNAYRGWEEIKVLVKPLAYKIVRNGKPVLLETNAVTFVVRKAGPNKNQEVIF